MCGCGSTQFGVCGREAFQNLQSPKSLFVESPSHHSGVDNGCTVISSNINELKVNEAVKWKRKWW